MPGSGRGAAARAGRAMPSDAKISAPASGIAASSAAISGVCRAWPTRTYWASQLTTAAAAAKAPRAAMALRSHALAESPSCGARVPAGLAPGRAARRRPCAAGRE
jgi:hypothetical protein